MACDIAEEPERTLRYFQYHLNGRYELFRIYDQWSLLLKIIEKRVQLGEPIKLVPGHFACGGHLDEHRNNNAH